MHAHGVEPLTALSVRFVALVVDCFLGESSLRMFAWGEPAGLGATGFSPNVKPEPLDSRFFGRIVSGYVSHWSHVNVRSPSTKLRAGYRRDVPPSMQVRGPSGFHPGAP